MRKIEVGSRVRVLDIDEDIELLYRVTGVLPSGSNLSRPDGRVVSKESPVGNSLLGRTVGETVDIHTPSGVLHYEILEIN